MSDEENFREAFVVEEFTGHLEDLVAEIEGLPGVENASTSSTYQVISDGDMNMEIVYDPIETDRTQLALWIEDFESVDGDVTNA